MKEYRLVLVGFGNVGKAFTRLLLEKRDSLNSSLGIGYKVTGILTGKHGGVINPDGIDIQKALEVLEGGGNLVSLSNRPAPEDGVSFIKACDGDFLIETTPVNHRSGQPAIDHIKTALEKTMHAVTANKGPVVHGYRLLKEIAEQNRRKFYFESAVMDGAPIFSLFRETLPLADLISFKGILNSCTNMILGRMENGESMQEAITYGQHIGITETDPSADIDGWDAAIKVAALSTVLMGIPLTPQQVNRSGIREITQADIQMAKSEGKRWKLVCSADRKGSQVIAQVKPEMVSPDSVLYSIQGTSSYCQFMLDSLPGLGVVETDPGPKTTAYGMFADWLNCIKNE